MALIAHWIELLVRLIGHDTAPLRRELWSAFSWAHDPTRNQP